MYGKLISTEDERKKKNLEFKTSPEAKRCTLDEADIDDDNQKFSNI